MSKRFIPFLIAAAVVVQSPSLMAGAQAEPVFTLAQVSAERRPEVVNIDRFQVSPNDKFEPGTKLVFRVEGTANAKAFLTIPGSTDPLPMEEVKPGIYERAYTVRADDDLTKRFVNVRADLKRGQNVTTATLKPGEKAVTPGQGVIK
ncbi:hypothetical protein [Gloeobacter kilaueensis]|uniref:Uncharacterized protein n=1 Tax=Gloeobacter kilaueensis (strain ATCC BAA-2537 / CCAP 1431/1 / ULC 316 / JS1) TaxID=1183438 RepID=U5QG52_GLOK1|nr:hypothetical protein [Gloeobacter kilaueensis]AGY57896.1 hypothetical protein GKIL_1650 [Gloeobacter kilaueensis JS1]